MNINCPFCGGDIEATKKTYYSIIDGELVYVPVVNEPPSWDIYCENDCREMQAMTECCESELVGEINRILEQLEESNPIKA